MRVAGRVTMAKGSYFSKIFKIRKNGGADIVDLTEASEISVFFPLENGTFEELSLTNGDITKVTGAGGDFLLEAAEGVTSGFKEGLGQDLDVSWVIDDRTTIQTLKKVLDIELPQSTV